MRAALVSWLRSKHLPRRTKDDLNTRRGEQTICPSGEEGQARTERRHSGTAMNPTSASAAISGEKRRVSGKAKLWAGGSSAWGLDEKATG
ncbi:hypothetical protein V500_05397 [Pseudogymnoascus sp. VKM F-4518 (FW-2643)]|nr:hypothetical protein V500_05397 [Pseudogymnoascus sp. VKM F-4518 (FW-2643)]